MEIQLIQRWLSTVGEYVELRCKAMATFSAKSSASGSSSWPKIIIWVIDLYIKCHGIYNWVNMNSQCTLQKRLKFHGCSSCFIVCHPFLAAPCRQTRSLATCSHDQKISHWLQTLRREVKMWSEDVKCMEVPRPSATPTWPAMSDVGRGRASGSPGRLPAEALLRGSRRCSGTTNQGSPATAHAAHCVGP